MTRPRCWNRDNFPGYVHHGKDHNGQPTHVFVRHLMSQECGSFKDVQNIGNCGPMPLPVRDGWHCAGCRLVPAEWADKVRGE